MSEDAQDIIDYLNVEYALQKNDYKNGRMKSSNIKRKFNIRHKNSKLKIKT